MRSRTELPLVRQVSSDRQIWLVSLVSAGAIFLVAIFLQWLIYDDWMHRGSLRVVGSTLAAFLTFVFVFRWRRSVRRRKIEILRRFERIRWMNDRIRNSLQAIECLTWSGNPHATDPVRSAVDAIEDVLHEVFVESYSGFHGAESLREVKPAKRPA
ncbi:MAG: hypothetical protein WA891_15560 [Acidobacteriaceae bacterium]|jgi:hypothetical protein